MSAQHLQPYRYKQRLHPVFADPRRNRGWRTAALLILLGMLLTAAYQILVPLSNAPLRLSATAANSSADYPRQLLEGVDPNKLPALYNKEYNATARLARVQNDGIQTFLIDPVTGAFIRYLKDWEVKAVGDHTLVTDRSGTMPNRTLALTFDDGPDPTWTPLILDALAEEHVPATFFVIGKNVAANPEIFQRLIREGHMAGNHTFDHDGNFAAMTTEEARDELTRTDHIMRAVGHYASPLFRLPYGDLDHSPLEVLTGQQMRYLQVDFDIDSNDWRYEAAASQQSIPIPTLDGNGHIVLMHDGGGNRAATVAMLKKFIKEAKAQGYKFTTLAPMLPTDYLPVKNIEPSLIDNLVSFGATITDTALHGLLNWLFVLGVITVVFFVIILEWSTAIRFNLRSMQQAKAAATEETIPSAKAQPSDAVVWKPSPYPRNGAPQPRTQKPSPFPRATTPRHRPTPYKRTEALPRPSPRPRPRPHLSQPLRPPVVVIVPAHNEGDCLVQTLTALHTCRGEFDKVIVVDDGSTDNTYQIATGFAKTWPTLKVIWQPNGKKHAALNNGFRKACEISENALAVAIDGDTQLVPGSITELVAPFSNPRVGAVSGQIMASNHGRNALTGHQGLEFIASSVPRIFQARMNAQTVIPGAIGAWRVSAVLDAGGFSADTVAEDCDMMLTLAREGWESEYAKKAIAWTQVPWTILEFVKQRHRWGYGTMQALWKHRGMMLNPNYGWLGMVTLPYAVLSILIPMLFMPLTYTVTFMSLRDGNWQSVALFAGFILTVQLVTSILGMWTVGERQWKRHLRFVPTYRVVDDLLKIPVLYGSVICILLGKLVRFVSPKRMVEALVVGVEAAAAAISDTPDTTDGRTVEEGLALQIDTLAASSELEEAFATKSR